jgi:hypothetical protein
MEFLENILKASKIPQNFGVRGVGGWLVDASNINSCRDVAEAARP